MNKMSDGQRRRIFGLRKEKGLDEDTFRAYLFNVTGKSSLKELSIREAITVIDGLEGRPQRPEGKITTSQLNYIETLAKKFGWVLDSGEVDIKKLTTWVENKFNISQVNWLTKKQAQNVIEGLKVMIRREEKERHGVM